MVAALTARVEEHVLVHGVAAAEAIVEVEASTGKVEHDIVAQCGLRSLGLEECRRLPTCAEGA